MLLKTFGWSAAITIAGLVGGFLIGGTVALVLLLCERLRHKVFLRIEW